MGFKKSFKDPNAKKPTSFPNLSFHSCLCTFWASPFIYIEAVGVLDLCWDTLYSDMDTWTVKNGWDKACFKSRQLIMFSYCHRLGEHSREPVSWFLWTLELETAVKGNSYTATKIYEEICPVEFLEKIGRAQPLCEQRTTGNRPPRTKITIRGHLCQAHSNNFDDVKIPCID